MWLARLTDRVVITRFTVTEAVEYDQHTRVMAMIFNTFFALGIILYHFIIF